MEVFDDALSGTIHNPPLLLDGPLQASVRGLLVLILQCILVLYTQSIDFRNEFSWADIPIREPVFIQVPRYFNSDGGQCNVFIILNKSLCGQLKATCLWYENLQNRLLDHGFVLIKVYP